MKRSHDVRVIAVDWSGRVGPSQKNYIWLAEAVDGRLVRLENGRSRDELIDHLIGLAAEDSRFVVGFDFAFSLPAWYLAERNIGSAAELWERVADELKRDPTLRRWLGNPPEPPFWRARGGAPDPSKQFRQTEDETRGMGAQPESVFKLVGARQVGPGSLFGMPALARLKADGFSIWPFDDAGSRAVVEIFPRLWARRVIKSDAAQREHYFRSRPMSDELRLQAACSSDAFDAAVSALAMSEWTDELLSLRHEPAYAQEGKIWYRSESAGSTARIVVVRAGESGERQRIGYTVGVSADVCGSTGLSLSYVVVPPGGVADAHSHDGFETAIYQLSGRVETRFGPDLAESVVTEEGDFLFVPPGVPHQPRNLSDMEPATAIVARNDPRDEERTVPYVP